MNRVQPRRLAPNLLGGGNVVYGVIGLVDPQRTVGYSYVPGPLAAWAILFIALGIAILVATRTINAAITVSVAAVMIWLAWATFSVEARLNHPHLVTWKGPALLAWLAALHYLLSPYRRRT